MLRTRHNKWIETYLQNILNGMKGVKLVETLKITFKKPKGQDSLYKTAHFNSKTLTTTNNIEIGELLKLASEQITKKIAQWLSEGSGWIIESVDKYYSNIVKYKPMKGNSSIPLPKELQNVAKGLINLKTKIINVSVGVI